MHCKSRKISLDWIDLGTFVVETQKQEFSRIKNGKQSQLQLQYFHYKKLKTRFLLRIDIYEYLRKMNLHQNMTVTFARHFIFLRRNQHEFIMKNDLNFQFLGYKMSIITKFNEKRSTRRQTAECIRGESRHGMWWCRKDINLWIKMNFTVSLTRLKCIFGPISNV